VLDDAGTADVLVAAEDNERWEPVLHGLVRVGQAELHRVLRGEEGDDARARDRLAEVRNQVPQVVLLLRAHGAIGEHHAHVAARERADGVIEVDPGVDAFARPELRPGGTELGRDHRIERAEVLEEGGRPLTLDHLRLLSL
jgi:hypothetical protein